MGKDNNTNSKQSSKSRSRSDDQVKINCILRFKEPKPSDHEIKAKFFEADGTEVSEQIRKFKTGDNDALVALMNEIVGLGDLYVMWENGGPRKLAQTLLRALKGKARTDWLAIINDHEREDNSKQNFIRLLQQLGLKAFGPKAFKDQCKAMDKGKIGIPENNLRKGTERLFKINKLLLYLGIYAQEYTIEETNKVIVKSLPPKVMVKYFGEGGDDLEDEDDILELMQTIENKFKLKAEAAALELKANPKEHSNHSKGKEKSSDGCSKSGGKNPCRKHDGAHEWKDCPNYKPPNKAKEDLHSTTNKTIVIKMPTVRINEEPQVKILKNNSFAELNYSSDEGSAMMVQGGASSSNQPQLVNGITVIEFPAQDGTRLGTTILIDNGFSGHAIMSHAFAKSLGYEFQPSKGNSYRTTTGHMATQNQITIQ